MTLVNVFLQDDILYIAYFGEKLVISDSKLKEVLENFWNSNFINKVVLVEKSDVGILISKRVIMDKEILLPKGIFNSVIKHGK